MKNFVVIDFETGGLDPKTAALCSVGMVVLDGTTLKVVDQYYSLIQDEPEKIISPEALAVNGITLDQIKSNGLSIGFILNMIIDYLDNATIVCHNAAYDIAFLKHRGFVEYTEAVDTMDIAWKIWPYQKAKLALVCQRANIEVENAHNSLGDALMTAKLLQYFAKIDPEYLNPKPINFDRWKK